LVHSDRLDHDVKELSMTVRPQVLAAAAFVASAIVLLPTAGHASGRAQTLRFYDKAVSIKLTHADGTVVAQPPYPQAKAGDTLDVNSLDYVGNHIHHARRWTGSTHLRCVFRAGPPTCESHVAIGSSLLVVTGSPGKVTNGTGIYQGATGRVVSSKELPNDASDVVLRIQLAG
jgi:hypothetical protein